MLYSTVAVYSGTFCGDVLWHVVAGSLIRPLDVQDVIQALTLEEPRLFLERAPDQPYEVGHSSQL